MFLAMKNKRYIPLITLASLVSTSPLALHTGPRPDVAHSYLVSTAPTIAQSQHPDFRAIGCLKSSPSSSSVQGRHIFQGGNLSHPSAHTVKAGISVLITMASVFLLLALLKHLYMKHRRIQSIHQAHPEAQETPEMASTHRPFDPAAYEGLIVLGPTDHVEKAPPSRRASTRSALVVGMLGSPNWETRMVREVGEHRWRERRNTRARSLNSQLRGTYSTRTTLASAGTSMSLGYQARSTIGTLSTHDTRGRPRSSDQLASRAPVSVRIVHRRASARESASMVGSIDTTSSRPAQPRVMGCIVEVSPNVDNRASTSEGTSPSESSMLLPCFPSPPVMGTPVTVVSPVFIGPPPALEKPSDISACMHELDIAFKRVLKSSDARRVVTADFVPFVETLLENNFEMDITASLRPSLLLPHEIVQPIQEDKPQIQYQFTFASPIRPVSTSAPVQISPENSTLSPGMKVKTEVKTADPNTRQDLNVDKNHSPPRQTPQKPFPFELSNRQLARVSTHIPFPLVAPPASLSTPRRTATMSTGNEQNSRSSPQSNRHRRPKLEARKTQVGARPSVPSPLRTLAFAPGSCVSTQPSITSPSSARTSSAGNALSHSLADIITELLDADARHEPNGASFLIARDDELPEHAPDQVLSEAGRQPIPPASEETDSDTTLSCGDSREGGSASGSDCEDTRVMASFVQSECAECCETCTVDLGDADLRGHRVSFCPKSFWDEDSL